MVCLKKKYSIIIAILSSIGLAIAIFILCFFTIPRITYGYDNQTDTYYVDKVYGNAKEYTILDTIDNKPVTKIQSRAFMNQTNLVTLHMGKNISIIERLAFLDCKKLEAIDLTRIEFIGRNAFENCISLKEIDLTAHDISGGSFIGCTSLSRVSLTSTSTIGSYAFYKTDLQEITIPASCTLVGEYAFDSCPNLKKIIVLSEKLQSNAYLKSLKGVVFP